MLDEILDIFERDRRSPGQQKRRKVSVACSRGSQTVIATIAVGSGNGAGTTMTTGPTAITIGPNGATDAGTISTTDTPASL